MRFIFYTFFLIIVIITVSCSGWHLSKDSKISENIKIVTLDSSDPYGPFSSAIRSYFRLNRIILVENNDFCRSAFLLRLLKESINKDILSIIDNGNIVECQITMVVKAHLIISNREIYPICIKIHRSFLDHSNLTLQKHIVQQSIINEMYHQASEELLHQFNNIVRKDLLKSDS